MANQRFEARSLCLQLFDGGKACAHVAISQLISKTLR